MTPEPVEIAAFDGCILRGQHWAGESTWVVLLHDVGSDEDLDRWRPLIPSLLAERLSVLAVDLRGHGASDGEWDEDAAVGDVVAGVEFARAQGAACVVVIAAGGSADDALWAMERTDVNGLVLVSPTWRGARPWAQRPQDDASPSSNPGRTAVRPDILPPVVAGEGRGHTLPRGAGVPKLFLVGAKDPSAREITERLRAASIGWALTVSLPTEVQGTALLDGPWAGHVREQVAAFVRERRFAASASPTSGPAPPLPADVFLERLGIKPKGETT
jgi:pimeloyl-ACP methyl ester carboxylesterase